MKKIGIIVAMQKELELFTSKLNNLTKKEINHHVYYFGYYKDLQLCISVSGIGKVCAALTVSAIINIFTPDFLINIGISGGIDKSLKIGDIVVGKDIVYHDVWCGIPNKRGQVQDFPEIYHSDSLLVSMLSEFKQGLLCCGDQFITKQDELEKIKSNFTAGLAVDMESCSIAQTCYIYNLPFISIRQISDVPSSENHQEQYESFWENAPEHSVNILLKFLDKISD